MLQLMQFAYANDDIKKVLFISSYSYDWSTVPLQIEGVESVLADFATISYEFMDTKKVYDEESIDIFYKSIKHKLHKPVPYNAVILGDDAALQFALEHRQELCEAISALNESTIPFYLICGEDKLGNLYSSSQVEAIFSTYAELPVFRMVQAGVGNGVLGGNGVSHKEEGAIAAKMVLDILNGTPPQSIDAVRDNLDKINNSSKYLLSIINDILEMSRIDSGKAMLRSRKFNLNEAIMSIGDIIQNQALEKNIHFNVELNENLASSYIGDSVKLKQIIMNLLSNALKFLEDDGKINLSLKEMQNKEGDNYIEIEVKDNGIGIEKCFIDKMFDPFEQANKGTARNQVGSGLGLSIVK
ncbi:MAG: sensor histidine kinase [Anaerotignaceae bacterium]